MCGYRFSGEHLRNAVIQFVCFPSPTHLELLFRSVSNTTTGDTRSKRSLVHHVVTKLYYDTWRISTETTWTLHQNLGLLLKCLRPITFKLCSRNGESLLKEMASNEAKRSHCRGSGVQQPPGRERKSPHQNPLGRERPEGIVQRLTFALTHPHLGRDVVAMFACASESRIQQPVRQRGCCNFRLALGCVVFVVG